MNMGLVPPKKGFLETLRRLSDEYNIVLLFDEIKTGSKFYGGASEYYKIKPDLMTIGGAIAGVSPVDSRRKKGSNICSWYRKKSLTQVHSIQTHFL